MCTVSIIALRSAGGAYRLVTNRDEQRTRARGEAPTWRTLGGVRAISPRDPNAGGTWVATSESGLSLCLLNGNLEPPPDLPARPRSRGLLIGSLIGLGSIERVIDGLARMDLSPFPPFRLVGAETAAGGPRLFDAFWNRESLVTTVDHRAPVCFVSSGLGDSMVAPRLPLFDEMVGRNPTAEAQDAFHVHAWAERPEISVLMTRGDAMTVSITSVSVEPVSGGLPQVLVNHRAIRDSSSSPLASARDIG